MTACRRQTIPYPPLRLVIANPHAARRLMPLRELERRLTGLERCLGGRHSDPRQRADLLRQRALIAKILATRLTAPTQARRLEQELRWLAPRAAEPAPTPLAWLVQRMRAVLRHMDPPPQPSRLAGL